MLVTHWYLNMQACSILILTTLISLITARTSLADNDDCATPDQEIGQCISIHDCEPVKEFLKGATSPLPPRLVEKLRSYECGYDRIGVKVCCPKDSTPEPPDVSNHRNAKLLPEECGIDQTSDRIIFGEKTVLFEFPWMALLSYNTSYGPRFQCGGTIINDKYILTAAHCIKNVKTPLIGVRVGEYDITKPIDCEMQGKLKVCAPPVQDLAIEEILPHPEYHETLFFNDIGLLRVSKMNTSIESVRPICLPFGDARSFDFTNKKGTITGWGTTEDNVPSQDLLKIHLPFMPMKECVKRYDKRATITYKQLCAGGNAFKGDSCKGDSGGPLQVISEVNGDTRFVQHGVVSFGTHPCGRVDKPGVYTRITYYMPWILDNIRP